MGLDFLGRPTDKKSASETWGMMKTILSFWVFLHVIVFIGFNVKWYKGIFLSIADYSALGVINVTMILFTIYATASTRGSLREKYLIREKRFFDLEDCFCAAFCMPCTICQMARHTASYNDYDGVCCNSTGIPEGLRVDKRQPSQGSNYVV
jgi:Cys-rich protein (TIGR01571 family)